MRGSWRQMPPEPPEPALTRQRGTEPVSHVRQGAQGYTNPEVRPNDRILRVDEVAEVVSICFKRRLPLCAFFCLSFLQMMRESI